LRLTPRQKQVITIVCRELGDEKAVLLRRLIDTHLDPIAVRYGLAAKSKPIDDTKLKDAVPTSMRKLTRSQLSCLVDMYLKGWKLPDLANFYYINQGDLEELLGDKTDAQVRELRATLRRIVSREKRKWLRSGRI
jgi:hypothetical protein